MHAPHLLDVRGIELLVGASTHPRGHEGLKADVLFHVGSVGLPLLHAPSCTGLDEEGPGHVCGSLRTEPTQEVHHLERVGHLLSAEDELPAAGLCLPVCGLCELKEQRMRGGMDSVGAPVAWKSAEGDGSQESAWISRRFTNRD